MTIIAIDTVPRQMFLVRHMQIQYQWPASTTMKLKKTQFETLSTERGFFKTLIDSYSPDLVVAESCGPSGQETKHLNQKGDQSFAILRKQKTKDLYRDTVRKS